MAQEKTKIQHPGENDACHVTGINKYLLKKLSGVVREHIVRMNEMKKGKKRIQINITVNQKKEKMKKD